MKIDLKLMSVFAQYLKCDSDGKTTVKDGSTVLDVVRFLDMPEDQVRIVAVNGKQTDLQTKLNEGDIVFIFPPAAGGG
jgi:molybdopterin converting factor small subunit